MKQEPVSISSYNQQVLAEPRKRIVVGGLPVLADLIVPEGWATTSEIADGRVHLSFAWARCGDKQYRFSSHFVRDKFMEITDADHALEFFRCFGPLQTSATSVGEIGKAESVTFSLIQTYQKHYRDAMQWSIGKEPKDWSANRNLMTEAGINGFNRDAALNLRRSPKMTLEMSSAKTATGKNPVVVPYFRVESRDVVSSIWASIYLDKARKLDGAVCAHCGDVFIRTGRHDKKYCDRTQCGSTRRVTEYRRQQKLKADGSNNAKA